MSEMTRYYVLFSRGINPN